nr:hypothetical protein [Cytophagales bacterium]
MEILLKRLILVMFILSGCSAGKEKVEKEAVKISHLQLIGSHNSYKLPIEPALYSLLLANDSASIQGLDYGHISPWEQLELGLRVLELDVFHDPEGGRFSNPLGNALLRQQGVTPEPYPSLEQFDQPGFKVMHVQDIDFRSHFPLFRDYLRELRAWSDLNPNHLPIFITLNAKDQNIPERGLTEALPFDAAAFEMLEAEIRQVLPREKYFIPAQLKQDFPTLKEAVLASGWPELKDIQGRFVFVLDEGGEKLAAYLEKDPSLERAIFFVNVPEEDPLAAMMILNDPIKDHQKIQTLVKAGYMIRTRADADTREARTNDTRKMEHAFSSGAQLISTDYYLPDNRMSPDYKVIFPNDAYIRLNPLFDNVETVELTDLETPDAVIALSPQEFKVAMAHDYGTVLDVRTDEEVKGGCLEKAVQADILSGQFEAHIKTMDKDMPVLVYCKVGARSAKAADRLIAEGFRKVYHLDGGIDGWIGSGEETVEYEPF